MEPRSAHRHGCKRSRGRVVGLGNSIRWICERGTGAFAGAVVRAVGLTTLLLDGILAGRRRDDRQSWLRQQCLALVGGDFAGHGCGRDDRSPWRPQSRHLTPTVDGQSIGATSGVATLFHRMLPVLLLNKWTPGKEACASARRPDLLSVVASTARRSSAEPALGYPLEGAYGPFLIGSSSLGVIR